MAPIRRARLKFVDVHPARILRAGHERRAAFVASEIDHDMGNRRFALRLVGMFPEKQVAGFQAFGPPRGVGRPAKQTSGTFEASMPANIQVLVRCCARQEDARCFFDEKFGGVGAIHGARATIARQLRAGIVGQAQRFQIVGQFVEALGRRERPCQEKQKGYEGRPRHKGHLTFTAPENQDGPKAVRRRRGGVVWL